MESMEEMDLLIKSELEKCGIPITAFSMWCCWRRHTRQGEKAQRAKC